MEHHEIINVRLGEGDRSVVLLDQTELPNRVVYRTVTQLADMVEAIHALRVRGAPAIGIFAGYCLYVLARQVEEWMQDPDQYHDEILYYQEFLPQISSETGNHYEQTGKEI